MAVYRNVQLSFWTDTKITDEFTPEDKYFYLYLLTNPHTKISGCYELSIRQMSIDTGYSKDTIEKLLERMQNIHKVIQYSKENKEILIINWAKYNWTTSPLVRKSIEKSLNTIKTADFKNFLSYLYNHIDTLSIGYSYPIESTFSLVSFSLVNDNDVDSKKEEQKKHESEVDEFFESIWKLYIRKEGKNGVTKAAKEEIFKVGYDRMAECIKTYAREKVGCDKRYILMGSTFFNGRYKDYLEEPKKEPQPEEVEEEPEMTDEEWAEKVRRDGVI